MLRRMTRPLSALVLALGAAVAFPQPDQLTLQEALRLAQERNGAVRAAKFNLMAAESSVRQAAGAFLPTLTPAYRYDASETETFTGGRGTTGIGRSSMDVTASWRLLDTGERSLALRGARRGAEAQRLDTLQTLRSTLFTVHQQFYEALRADELLRVQEAQLKRAEEILEQTKLRVQVEDAPRKDILQATADALNARASVLAARNRVSATGSALKATIGFSPAEPLPPLAAAGEAPTAPLGFTLEQAFATGIAKRPDLQSQREGIEARRLDARLAQIDSGVAFSVDASYQRSFAPGVQDFRGLVFQASIPLYDGNRSRERARTSRLQVDSLLARLEQSERDARAEIESAYKEYATNVERLQAAAAAREAARVNYQAAQEAQRLGAGTLIDVLTAQVTLVTAESNYVEAAYDSLISDVRLKLALGEALPGESTP